MGRGRAKAKQTKIARQLKYDGSATDLDRLRSELRAIDPLQDDPEANGVTPVTPVDGCDD